MTYETLNDYCRAKQVHVKRRTAWHYSLTKDGKRVDLFPKNMRFHIVHTNQRGDLPEELTDKIIFIETIFEL